MMIILSNLIFHTQISCLDMESQDNTSHSNGRLGAVDYMKLSNNRAQIFASNITSLKLINPDL